MNLPAGSEAEMVAASRCFPRCVAVPHFPTRRQSMRTRTRLFLASIVSILCLTSSLSAQFRPAITVNCARGESLAIVAANALPNLVINVKGTCAGPISITASGVQLKAVGTAGINGSGKDAVTVTGAQGVTLSGLSITGGKN